MKQVDVAVGVVYSQSGMHSILSEDTTGSRYFFICRRSAGQHQGNKWEFPGGKVNADETPLIALKRELKEEIDIDVINAQALIEISFDYPDKRVRLHVFLIKDFVGQARGAEGQQSQWVSAKLLPTLNFPDANAAILEALKKQGLI